MGDSSKPPNAGALVAQIHTAFDPVAHPGDDHLVDHPGSCWECDMLAQRFQGQDWRNIPLPALQDWYDAPIHLTPEANRYFLPAYLLAALMHYDEVEFIGDVVFSLTPPGDPEIFDLRRPRGLTFMEAYRRRMGVFSPAQLEALATFLEFMKANYPEDELGDNYDRALAGVRSFMRPPPPKL